MSFSVFIIRVVVLVLAFKLIVNLLSWSWLLLWLLSNVINYYHCLVLPSSFAAHFVLCFLTLYLINCLLFRWCRTWRSTPWSRILHAMMTFVVHASSIGTRSMAAVVCMLWPLMILCKICCCPCSLGQQDIIVCTGGSRSWKSVGHGERILAIMCRIFA